MNWLFEGRNMLKNTFWVHLVEIRHFMGPGHDCEKRLFGATYLQDHWGAKRWFLLRACNSVGFFSVPKVQFCLYVCVCDVQLFSKLFLPLLWLCWLGSAVFSVAGPSTSLTTMSLLAKNTPSRSEMTKVQQQVKVNGASMTVLRREMQELRVKQLEQQKQLQDQEQKLLEQTQVIAEQNARLAELEHKLRELMDSSTAAMGEARPTASSSAASTSVSVFANGNMAACSLPRQAEGEGVSSFKRRKSLDLPRQSKRLRSKKWKTQPLIYRKRCFGCRFGWLLSLPSVLCSRTFLDIRMKMSSKNTSRYHLQGFVKVFIHM